MLFSVIIPTFNRLKLLDETLRSVFGQRFDQFEVIVVDDGSDDGTREYLLSLGHKVRLLGQDNRGPGAARNLGASHASGEYLAFLDSDDLWFPWTLQIYHDVVQRNRKPSFVVGKPFLFAHRSGLETVPCVPTEQSEFADYLAAGNEWRWWGASSFLVRRDAFLEVGGFANKKQNGEDADLALRLGSAPGFIQITAPHTFAYRQHALSAVSDFGRTIAGARLLIRSERDGTYPGGRVRKAARWRIVTRHTRPVTMECLRQGLLRDGWDLYRSTFSWNLALGRLRFLVGFPFLAVAHLLHVRKLTALP